MKYYMCYFYDTGFEDNCVVGVNKDPKECLEKSKAELINDLSNSPEDLEEYPDNFLNDLDTLLKVIPCTKNLYDMVQDGDQNPSFVILNGVANYFLNYSHLGMDDVNFDAIQGDNGTLYKLIEVFEEK